MADFTSNVAPVEMPQAPNIVVPADTSTANAILAGGNILGTIGQTLAQGYNNAQVQAKSKEQARVMNQFSQNLLRISDLDQQGAFKSGDAIRQYRLQFARTLANNPTMEKDLLETYKAIVGTPGLGENVAKDFQQGKDNQNALILQNIQDAQKAGWGNAQMPMDEQVAWSEKHQQFLFAQSQMEAANAVLEHKIKENNLVSSGLSITSARLGIATGGVNLQRARLALAKDQSQQQFLNGVKNLSDAYFPKYSNDLEQITSAVKNGQMNKEDAIRQVQTQFAQMQQQVSGIALAHDNPGSVEAFMKPFELMTQRSIDQLNGKTLNTVATNDIANIQALQQQQLLVNDPDFLKLSAVSKTIPAGMGALQTSLGNVAIDMLKKAGVINGDGTAPPNPVSDGTKSGSSGVKQFFDVLKRAMVVGQSDSDPQLHQEIDAHVANVLHGVGVYGGTAQSPADLNHVVKYLASPEFGAYVKSNPNAVAGPNAERAKDVYTQEYQQKILPLIQDQFTALGTWSNATVQTGTTMVRSNDPRVGNFPQPVATPTAEVVHPVFNGTGVSFVADPKYTNIPQVQQKVKELNSQVAPVMNTLIRANAHLAGSSNYKSAYEALMEQLAPPSNED